MELDGRRVVAKVTTENKLYYATSVPMSHDTGVVEFYGFAASSQNHGLYGPTRPITVYGGQVIVEDVREE
jgi:hypothetical protein